jgi:hypothetical protein
MPLRLSQFTDAVHEIETLAKVTESVGLLQVMLIDYPPVGNLPG